MKKYLLFLSVALLLKCGSPSGGSIQSKIAKGDRAYGGTLKLNETDKFVTLFPHHITDAISNNLAIQLYDGLIRFDSKNINRVLPCIAESWQIDETGTQYTFTIKKGIKYHDDPCFPEGKGREVKAADFKYVFELLCKPTEDAGPFEASFRNSVKGANEFYENCKAGKNTSGGIEGVKVMSDYTLQITLNAPSSTFLYILAGPAGYLFPREAFEKYTGDCTVGTGPFILSSSKNDSIVLLVKNQNYFRSDSLGNQLPFLDSILIHFIPDKNQELQAFKDGNTHMIFGLPSSEISHMVEDQLAAFNSKNPKYILHRSSEMTTEFYQFNVIKPPFNNLKVRQAFSYAIDREKIISDVLNTEAFGPGICGITAPGIPDYDITTIAGYHFVPEKAKKLLAEAGYPNGKNFPHITIELNSGGGKHLSVFEEVKKQLKEVLNIDVDFVVVPFAQKLDDAKYGRAEMFRSAWIADYPSPENFLSNYYGVTVPDSAEKPSYPNTTRYKNPVFDSLLVQGFTAKNQKDAYAYFMKAEQVMIQDAPVIVLWYGENFKMIHSFVKNFYFNPMNLKDFSEVYIKKPSESAKP